MKKIIITITTKQIVCLYILKQMQQAFPALATLLKHLTFLSIISILSINLHGQDFAGYKSGNYTGVNGVFFNPANIADSRYAFDLNLFSLSTALANNKASFSLKNLSESFNLDSLQQRVFSRNSGTSSGFTNIDVHGPSFMFNTGKKTAIAVTSRVRGMININDLDGGLVQPLLNNFTQNPSLPYNIASTKNMYIAANVWSEFGLSIGRVLSDKGKHFFKGGVSLKYLAGAANGYVSINKFNGTLNADAQGTYITNASSHISSGFGGVRLSGFKAGQLTQMKSTGFGADIGFVYEFRPGYEKFQDNQTGNWKNNMNKYKLKIGIALLDIGSIKYDKDVQRSGGYNMNIAAGEQFYLQQLQQVNIDDYKSFFSNHPNYFTPDAGNAQTSYKVALPTTLQADADYHLHKGFYINLAGQLAFSNSKPFNSNYQNSICLTPRFEGKGIGLYLPVSYNALSNFNAGVSLRLGPMFVGSSSLLTALTGKSKQADIYIGCRFGFLH